MKWDSVQQLIRIVIQIAAGALVSRGFITEDLATQLTGGVMSLATVVWWMFWESGRPEKKTST